MYRRRRIVMAGVVSHARIFVDCQNVAGGAGPMASGAASWYQDRRSWKMAPSQIVMAGRVPVTHPQPVGPLRRLYNRRCVGGRDTPGHDGESMISSHDPVQQRFPRRHAPERA